MKELINGHLYDLENFGDDSPEGFRHCDELGDLANDEFLEMEGYKERKQTIRFRANEPDGEGDQTPREWPGVTTQEILRVLISRTNYCDGCIPSMVNPLIIHHLRMALVLHEARALVSKVYRGEMATEKIVVSGDGHFKLTTAPGKSASFPSVVGRTMPKRGL